MKRGRKQKDRAREDGKLAAISVRYFGASLLISQLLRLRSAPARSEGASGPALELLQPGRAAERPSRRLRTAQRLPGAGVVFPRAEKGGDIAISLKRRCNFDKIVVSAGK